MPPKFDNSLAVPALPEVDRQHPQFIESYMDRLTLIYGATWEEAMAEFKAPWGVFSMPALLSIADSRSQSFGLK